MNQLKRALLHGFDYRGFLRAAPTVRMGGVVAAMDHILKQDDGRKRFLQGVTALSRAFALAVPADEAIGIRDDVGFFQTIRVDLVKTTPTLGKPQEDLDVAVRQIVSKAVALTK